MYIRRDAQPGSVVKGRPDPVVYLLLGTAYNRHATQQLARLLRQRGAAARYVVAHAGIMHRRSDALFVSQIVRRPVVSPVVLVGDDSAVQDLLTLPLVHRLLQTTAGSGGCVGALAGALPQIEATGLLAALPESALLLQRGSLEAFVQALLPARLNPALAPPVH